MLNLIRKPWVLVIISALFFYISWPPLPFPWLIFAAITPLLYIHEKYYNGKNSKWGYYFKIYIAFLLWNVADTWWVYLASPMAIFAMTLNSIFMTLPFIGFARLRKRFNYIFSSVALVFFWIAFEYIHMQWDISWPWLTLGNVFANTPGAVQWYEFTGVSGGTLWVWIINIMFTGLIIRMGEKPLQADQSVVKRSALLDLMILIPLIISGLMDRLIEEKGQVARVMMIQPNLDPYTEKFNGLPAAVQLQRMLEMAENKLDTQVRFLILPETAITESVNESYMEDHSEIRMLREFMFRHPGISILTGAVTYREFHTVLPPSETAREEGPGLYIDYYNSALLLDATGKILSYHKSKLVPGVEKMPFPAVFKFLERFSIDNGGISGSLGTDPEPKVLGQHEIRSAPVICYESIYGDYVRKYIKKGANLITIITNDGWWGNTDGYKQHLKYGTLRAIETRTSIARCANTGISCFVDQSGRIYQEGAWWEPEVIVGNVHLNQGQTFFVRYGDLISPIGIIGSLLAILISYWYKFKNKSSTL